MQTKFEEFPDNLSSDGAQRKPKSHLALAQTAKVIQSSVEANAGQQNCRGSECGQQDRPQTILLLCVIQLLLQRHDGEHRSLRFKFMDPATYGLHHGHRIAVGPDEVIPKWIFVVPSSAA